MGTVLDAVNRVAFTVGADEVTVAELLGFVTGAWCVWLTVRARVSNFPVGLANSAFFLVLFWSVGLYANAGLQVVYLALGVVGWWRWLYGGEARTPLVTEHASRTMLAACAVAAVGATVALVVILDAVNGSAPFWDAATTALSLVAQWLLNEKKVETWYVWAAVDLVYVPLYASQHLYLTSAVYALFLAMCVKGLAEWRRAVVAVPAPGPAQAPVAA